MAELEGIHAEIFAQATIAALNEMVLQVRAATIQGLAKAGTAVKRAAMEQVTGPPRLGVDARVPREGSPGLRSGYLRRSIHSETPHNVGGVWMVRIGPSAIYGRALELGHPRWYRTQAGAGGYPYMAPALQKAEPIVYEILRSDWSRALFRALDRARSTGSERDISRVDRLAAGATLGPRIVE